MKVYTVIAKYSGYDEYPDKYIGTFDSLETIIEQEGINGEYLIKSWGGVPQYIEWLNTTDGMNFDTDTGKCYRLSGRNLEMGYSLYVYVTEIISKLEYKFLP